MRIPERLWSIAKFLFAGLPAFLLAVPLNWLLVEIVRLPHSVAYAVVLVLQVSFNYVMCRAFVFRVPGRRASLGEYGRFVPGILGFRVLDWGVYLLLVKGLGVYYLTAQVFNVVVFVAAKFLYSERILSGPRGSSLGRDKKEKERQRG